MCLILSIFLLEYRGEEFYVTPELFIYSTERWTIILKLFTYLYEVYIKVICKVQPIPCLLNMKVPMLEMSLLLCPIFSLFAIATSNWSV